MLWRKREPGPSAIRRQPRAFRPSGLGLESRRLLAIDLANIAGNAALTPPGPYGILEAGGVNGGGAGWSVANVGDVNGDGFDDFLIGAPGVTSNGALPTLGNGGNGRAYLVFGSQQSDNTDFAWLNITNPDFRVGDLNNLGNLQQNNPLNGNPSYNFNGVTFITGQQNLSSLGASVANVGDIDGSGFSSFMIGAPGADGGNGRAYLIYGGSTLSSMVNKTVDLDNLGGSPGVNVLTFTNTSTNARSGRSVGVAGPFLNDGFTDILIGAPNATVTGNSGQGAVYAVAGNFLRPARTLTVPLNLVGQLNSGVPGLILAGANSGDATGRSVAGAGDVDGATTSTGQVIADVVIGAPQVGDTGAANGAGKAYLVYGGDALIRAATTINGVVAVNLANVGTTVPGAIFTGETTGDETGFAVSSAGDFNGDGLGDFLIGSPGWTTGQGRATLIEGVTATTTTGRISGTFALSALPSTVPFVEFDGQSGDAAAGFSVGVAGPIITAVKEELLIGTPGFNGGQGAAFVIPANAGLFGVQTLTESAPVFATEITNSVPATPSFLGSGVGGNLFLNLRGGTADGDARQDFIIGASGFSLSAAAPRPGAGGGFMLEGFFIPIQTPVISALTSQIGVDAPFSAPFRISATTPTTVQIFVFSNTASGTPNFVPLRDLDPTTVKVNGVAFPTATIAADPVDENADGLQDAIITITPRSALNLNASTTTFTLSAKTLAGSPNAGKLYSSSTSIIVAGAGPGGGGIPTERLAAFGLNNPNAAVPLFGGRLIPAPQTLSRLRWKPLPQAVAYNQYLPPSGFTNRIQYFYHPKKVHPSGSRFDTSGGRTSTLGRDVFKRGRFPAGVFGGPIFHNQQPTIPPSLHHVHKKK